jgi:hypothetical protein
MGAGKTSHDVMQIARLNTTLHVLAAWSTDQLRYGFLCRFSEQTGMRLAGSGGGNESLVAGTEPAKSLRYPQSRRVQWLVMNPAACSLADDLITTVGTAYAALVAARRQQAVAKIDGHIEPLANQRNASVLIPMETRRIRGYLESRSLELAQSCRA